MIVEHWIDDGADKCGVSTVFTRGEDRTDLEALLYDCPVHCCDIEGKDWTDCMTQYHEHMGWEPYRPMDGESE